MRILILGGDGYLGWPTAMFFSAKGHEVVVVDNYLRRNIAQEQDSENLFELPNLIERCRIWKEVSGHSISARIGDITNWKFISDVLGEFKPETIIHYAEQPSAPYSMLNYDAAKLTLHNNLGTTFNTIYAMREHTPGAHLVKLGTMGEYGVPNIDIEEGWLDIEHKGRKDKFLFPRQAGSLYHTTKIQDTDLIWYYVRMWGLRVTDLMQGPVYGIFTDENIIDSRLYPHFAYDELFGTVLNRFVTQAVIGYPLTVYGAGGQTRGYLNLKDTLQCVNLSAQNPPDEGELRIFNQFTETFSVNELAKKVQSAGKSIGLEVEIQQLENPRIEKEEHYYNPAHTGLLDLGLMPNLLTEEVLVEMLQAVTQVKGRIAAHKIFRNTKWA